jgi:predicted DNA binding protein
MKHVGINFRTAGLGLTKAHKKSPLANLTTRQAHILRLAYSLGYYDIPKKAMVEDVARLLGLDKGTAGEHLQRADKHVFDRLLQKGVEKIARVDLSGRREE